MDNNDFLQSEGILSENGINSRAAQVHKSQGLYQFDTPAADKALCCSVKIFFNKCQSMVFRQMINNHESYIVPRPGVLYTRITKTDNEPQKLLPLLLRGGGLFLFLALLDHLRLRCCNNLLNRCGLFFRLNDIYNHLVRVGKDLDPFLELKITNMN